MDSMMQQPGGVPVFVSGLEGSGSSPANTIASHESSAELLMPTQQQQHPKMQQGPPPPPAAAAAGGGSAAQASSPAGAGSIRVSSMLDKVLAQQAMAAELLLPTAVNINPLHVPGEDLLQFAAVQQYVQDTLSIKLPLLNGTFVLVPAAALTPPAGQAAGSSNDGRTHSSSVMQAAASAAAIPWRLRQVAAVEVGPAGSDPAAATVVLVGGARLAAGAVCCGLLEEVQDSEALCCELADLQLRQQLRPLLVFDVAHVAWRLRVACEVDAAIRALREEQEQLLAGGQPADVVAAAQAKGVASVSSIMRQLPPDDWISSQITPFIELSPTGTEPPAADSGGGIDLQPQQPLSRQAHSQLLRGAAAAWQQYAQRCLAGQQSAPMAADTAWLPSGSAAMQPQQQASPPDAATAAPAAAQAAPCAAPVTADASTRQATAVSANAHKAAANGMVAVSPVAAASAAECSLPAEPIHARGRDNMRGRQQQRSRDHSASSSSCSRSRDSSSSYGSRSRSRSRHADTPQAVHKDNSRSRSPRRHSQQYRMPSTPVKAGSKAQAHWLGAVPQLSPRCSRPGRGRSRSPVRTPAGSGKGRRSSSYAVFSPPGRPSTAQRQAFDRTRSRSRSPGWRSYRHTPATKMSPQRPSRDSFSFRSRRRSRSDSRHRGRSRGRSSSRDSHRSRSRSRSRDGHRSRPSSSSSRFGRNPYSLDRGVGKSSSNITAAGGRGSTAGLVAPDAPAVVLPWLQGLAQLLQPPPQPGGQDRGISFAQLVQLHPVPAGILRHYRSVCSFVKATPCLDFDRPRPFPANGMSLRQDAHRQLLLAAGGGSLPDGS